MQAKIASKFNEAAAKSTMAWIEKTTGESVKDFHEDLKDGIALCKLINALGTTVKYNDSSKLAFKCMERINLFIEGARQAGVCVCGREGEMCEHSLTVVFPSKRSCARRSCSRQ